MCMCLYMFTGYANDESDEIEMAKKIINRLEMGLSDSDSYVQAEIQHSLCLFQLIILQFSIIRSGSESPMIKTDRDMDADNAETNIYTHTIFVYSCNGFY